MKTAKLSEGVVHTIPADLRKALLAAPKAVEKWEDITPLARNEWICWVESVKQQKTRDDHVARVPKQLLEGKRRPCCWVGCLHRPGVRKWTPNKTAKQTT